MNANQVNRSRWTIYATAFLVATGFGSILPVLPNLLSSHGLAESWMAPMVAAYLLLNFAGQGPFGWASDRWGRKPFMVLGASLYAGCSLALAFTADPWIYVALRAGQGLGAAAFQPSARAALSDLTPKEHRGAVLGTMMSFHMGGIAAGPGLGGYAAQFFGINAPFLGGGALLTVAVLVLLTLPAIRPGAADRGADRGPVPLRAVLTPLVVGVLVIEMGHQYMLGVYEVNWARYLQLLGATPGFTGLSFTAYALPLILTGNIFGRLADRGHHRALILWGSVVSAACVYSYDLIPHPWSLFWFSAIDGVAGAAVFPALQSLATGAVPSHYVGRVLGLVGTAGVLAALLGSSASEWLYAVRPGLAFLVGATVVLAGALIGTGVLGRAEAGKRAAA